MDVFFHTKEGKCFAIEIGYFDTILEIKEKIQKEQNIPVSKQTLIFNGEILKDELYVYYSNIQDCSIIQLEVQEQEISSQEEKKEIEIVVKIPGLNPAAGPGNNNAAIFTVRIYPDDTISKLKDEIHTIIQRLNIDKELLCVHANGVELQDHRTILDCELSDSSEIDVTIRLRSSSTSPLSGGSNSSVNSGRTMKVNVLVNGYGSAGGSTGERKIPMEVNYMDNVGELKKELERLNEPLHLNLPVNGYFFIHKQYVMDDDRSFRWHHVRQGDILEVFPGTVTRGH